MVGPDLMTFARALRFTAILLGIYAELALTWVWLEIRYAMLNAHRAVLLARRWQLRRTNR
jgi:hypothetical protein